MVLTETYTGNALLQDELLHPYFEIDGDYVRFIPGDNTSPISAYFQNTCHPSFDNVSWVNAKLSYTLQALAEDPDFEAVITLQGLTEHGDPQIIAEKVITTISTTETTPAPAYFDLQSNKGQASLKKITGTAPTGKIQVNLPMRYENFEYVKFKRVGPEGATYSNLGLITGGNIQVLDYPLPITVTYDSDMTSDFSNLRFMFWDGKRLIPCCHYIVEKTDSSVAYLRVRIPSSPASPLQTRLYMFYGNPTATSQSNGFNTFTFYDNFGDGEWGRLYTESTPVRSGDYSDWILRDGTVAMESASPIYGSYSVKHTGNGSNTINNRLQRSVSRLPYRVNFKMKMTEQGTSTYTPSINLWFFRYVDSTNYIRLTTYYNSGDNKQKLTVQHMKDGTPTTLQTVDWLTGKLWTDTYEFRLFDSSSTITVQVDGVTKINVAYTPNIAAGTVAFGADLDTQAMFDEIWWWYPPSGNNPSSYPSIGAWGGKTAVSTLDPYSPLSSDLSVNYTVGASHPACILAKEYNSSEYQTMQSLSNPLDVFDMGMDSVDLYHALRFKVEVDAGNDVEFKVNYSQYEYESMIEG